MADLGCRVLWCPAHADRFVSLGHGQDLKLYKVVKAGQHSLQKGTFSRNNATHLEISDGFDAVLMSRISHIPFRCVAVYPKPDVESSVLVALGQLNGTVTVRTFDQTNTGTLFNEREFVPRHERPCTTLAWNPVNSNLLAAGLEKARNDVSFYVWDIKSKMNIGAASWTLDRTSRSALTDSRSLETGPMSETTSMAWLEPTTLIAGQGGKCLKIFDIRDKLDNTKAKQQTNTKAVHGVCVDHNFDYHVASFFEGQQGVVWVWDTRQFDKPLLGIPQNEHILQIDWNPTRSGLLGLLRKNNRLVHLYDIQYGSAAYGNASNEAEPTALERRTGAVDFTISGFSWYPTEENRMLTISAKENIKDLAIFERICLSWSPKFSLSWGCGHHLIQCSQESEENQDISIKMYNRAYRSYGIDWANTISVDDPQLLKLWAWFSRVCQVQKMLDTKFKVIKFPGVKSVICGESGSQGVCARSSEFKSPQHLATVYHSEERYVALQLCNWNFDGDNGSSNLRTFLQELTSRGEFERAAAIAVFNNDIPSAINILTDGANERLKDDSQQDPFLGMVAMALSGYSNDKKSLWRERSLPLCGQLSHPYLPALFTFLACDDDFTHVLKDCNLEIEDQVAFACKYLQDGKLGNFLSDLCDHMVKSGNLEGLLVTGMTEDGINLLQNYLNMTGDVQTVTLLCINSLPSKTVRESVNVNNWIQSYRDLLDTWKLWHQRAEFDIYHSSKGVSIDHKQVLVSCTFCGASILARNPNSLPSGRLRYLSPKENLTNKAKTNSNCVGCKKPLPRCSQCLMRMGTTSTNFSSKPKPTQDITVPPCEEVKINPTLKWFTWCQTCRHGGHASHMTEWFKEHTECPVNNCLCTCTSLDPVK